MAARRLQLPAVALAAVLAANGGALAQTQPSAADDIEAERAVTQASDAVPAAAEHPGAEPADSMPAPQAASVDGYHASVERLTEHFLGTASRPVRFDWRRSSFAVGVLGSELIERNNYGSFRLGGVARSAFQDIMVEVAVSYVSVLSTTSSDQLALTPYVQAGRPPRFEIDLNASYPIAEAPVTPIIDLIPPAELVLFATVGGRYLLYPQAVVGDRAWENQDTWTDIATWRDIGFGLAAPSLTEEDRLVIERDKLGGMLLDSARVHSLAGLTLDIYFQPGIVISPRGLLAVPILAPVSGTQLGFWWEISLAMGYAF